jgi:hypothetical protein
MRVRRERIDSVDIEAARSLSLDPLQLMLVDVETGAIQVNVASSDLYVDLLKIPPHEVRADLAEILDVSPDEAQQIMTSVFNWLVEDIARTRIHRPLKEYSQEELCEAWREHKWNVRNSYANGVLKLLHSYADRLDGAEPARPRQRSGLSSAGKRKRTIRLGMHIEKSRIP